MDTGPVEFGPTERHGRDADNSWELWFLLDVDLRPFVRWAFLIVDHDETDRLIGLTSVAMDSFTATTSKVEDVVLPPVNEDGGTGSSGSCVVCKEETSLPPVNEDGGTGSSGSCIIA
ncbi:hypothetical protein DFH07DRAFT_957538 [Mycena maculata]|uniref:Uncharacterized protein n=1 Tax=Mycena maculata TaxID=230809 RepID=A0AAD7JCB1_9AGAR|nr:hypothetical protein DFH07DRAFT_957538 [Mycena maculata]